MVQMVFLVDAHSEIWYASHVLCEEVNASTQTCVPPALCKANGAALAQVQNQRRLLDMQT
jgi:hypothetical protein